MKRVWVAVILCLVVSVAACKEKETAAPAEPAAKSTAPAPAAEPSLLSLGAGAVVVQKPQEASDAYSAFRLIDEAPDRGWSTPDGVVSPQTIVFALPGKCALSRLEFDTEGLKPGRAAKDVSVEVSDQSQSAGFAKVADVSLAENANHQSFPAAAGVPGRWLRLTVKNNHGDKDNIELLEVRAFGKQLEKAALVNVSGDYTSNVGDMQLKQDGASVAGCYGTNGGRIIGGVDGRTLKFTWREASGDAGTAVVDFSDDGNEFFGLYWHNGESGGGAVWSGGKATSAIAGCGLTSKSAEEQIANEIEKSGRARVYGINFDVDSATIKPESKPTLDAIAAVLKRKGDWKLTIEGHTDSTGGETHNQQLSEARAASVKKYLADAGIAAERLSAHGFGASKPVATNDTEIGRAQNRRVELVK